MTVFLFLAKVGVPFTGARPQILVVDDEPDILSAVRTVLEGTMSADVFVASSAAKGLQILRERPINLIMTDFKMPGMNGVEFMQLAREITPDAPIVLITAFERELVDAMEGSDAAQAVLLKPLSPRPLLQTVQKVLAEGVL